jgi:hypothetical protein
VDILHLGWVLLLSIGVAALVECGVAALAIGVALAGPRMGAAGAALVIVVGLPPALLFGLFVGALWMSVVPRRAERRSFAQAAARLGLVAEVAPDCYAAEGAPAGRRIRVKVARGAPGGGHLPGGVEASVDAAVGTFATITRGRAGLERHGADTVWLDDWWARPGVSDAAEVLFADLLAGSALSLSPSRLALHTGAGALPELEARVRALGMLAETTEQAPRPTIEGASALGRVTEALSGRSGGGLATLSNIARRAGLLMTAGIAVTWLITLVSVTLSYLR